jgi:hypothetical protein
MKKIGDKFLVMGEGLTQYRHFHLLESGDRKIDFASVAVIILEALIGGFFKLNGIRNYSITPYNFIFEAKLR